MSDTNSYQLTVTAPDQVAIAIYDAGISIPAAHASAHVGGSDPIQLATNAQNGLATAAQITQLETNTADIATNTADIAANTAILASELTAANLSGGSIGTIPYQSATDTTAMLSTGVDGYVLTSNGAAAPSWNQVSVSSVSGVLPAANGGTGHSSAVRGQTAKMTPTAHPVTTEGEYTIIANNGTLDSAVSSNMSVGATDTFSLRNTSGSTRLFRIYASVDASSTNNKILSIKLFKGVADSLDPIDDSQCNAFTGGSNEAAKLVTSWIVSLADDEEVAVYLANTSSNNDITIERMRLIAEAII